LVSLNSSLKGVNRSRKFKDSQKKAKDKLWPTKHYIEN